MSGEMTAQQALKAAYQKNGHLIPGATALTPFDEMARREATFQDEEARIREEAHSDWLAWIFEAGPGDMPRAMMRLFSYCRLYRPELVVGMTAAQLGALFGQRRATVVAMEKRVFKATLKKGGCRSTELPGGKSDHARAKYALAQRGNKNRARSVKK